MTKRIVPGALPLLMVLMMVAAPTWAAAAAPTQAAPTPATRVAALDRLQAELAARQQARRTPLYFRLLGATDGPQGSLNRNRDILLVGAERGRPRYYQTTNLNAARTVGVDEVWPGGAAGLALGGANAAGELAVWDAGRVLDTHVEFGGRVGFGDAAPSVNFHATHVAGTMIAAGINPQARGMSFAGDLVGYDWVSDEPEMAAAAAAGLLVSNHSYVYIAGWFFNPNDSRWYWYGDTDLSETEDAGFGIYIEDCRLWDEIAHDAPDYLIVKAAGNDRGDYGPAAGTEHYAWDNVLEDWVLSTTVRLRDGGADGFDSINYRGNCKNVLTVGAVDDIAAGWTQPGDVVMTNFSGWGPTDDGRIKPDLVANGVELTSCYIDSNTSYASLTGTSMATPNASGALHLLAQHWRATHGGQTASSATLKAVAIHTADEAGPFDGPDFKHGWGLLDAAEAALLIADDGSGGGRVVAAALAQGQRDTIVVYSDGSAPLAATLCWNDPATAVMPWGLNQTAPMLVNDLDLRLQRVSDAVTFFPWRLDPANPAAAAATFDNARDNVEQVEIPVVPPAYYRVIVSHKGTLTDGPQAYSLVLSGATAPPAAPVVSNVAFAQRTDGSGLVDVTYDLEDADSPLVTVALSASSDGGATWTLVVASVSGDVGAGVAPGTGKSLVWGFAADNPGVFAASAVLRVTATD